MTELLSANEMDAVCSSDLHQAEDAFDEIKARLLRDVTSGASLHRTRRCLKAIEIILAEQHEARRAGMLRT